MKYLYTVFFLLPCYLVSWSQEVSIITSPVTVRYYNMPENPLDPKWQTYSLTTFVADDEYHSGDKAERKMVQQSITLAGYSKGGAKSDFVIDIKIGVLFHEDPWFRSRKPKDPETGGLADESAEFYFVVKYAVPLSYSLMGNSGQLVAEKAIVTEADFLSYTSSAFKTSDEAKAWWNANKSATLSKLRMEQLPASLKKVGEVINQAHGYALKEETVHFETIGNNDHPLVESFKWAVNGIVSSLSLMQADHNLDPVNIAIAPFLDYYREGLSKYDVKNKDEVSLKHICYYNLALTWYWLEDFDQAQNYAYELLFLNQNDKGALKLIEDIKNTTAALKKSGRNTRHRSSGKS